MEDETWEYISNNDYDYDYEHPKIQLMNKLELKEHYLDLQTSLLKKEEDSKKYKLDFDFKEESIEKNNLDFKEESIEKLIEKNKFDL